MAQKSLTAFGTAAETPEKADDETALEDFTSEAQEVLELIDFEHIKSRLEGRDGGLRTSKPTANGDTGLEQYAWRMARFYSGADDCMPVMARSWLQSWLDEQGIDAKVSGITNDTGDEVVEVVDAVARLVLVEMGYDPDRGLKRWRKVLKGI